MEKLEFETITVPGAEAPETLARLRESRPDILPVILGVPGIQEDWGLGDPGLWVKPDDPNFATPEKLDQFDLFQWVADVENEYWPDIEEHEPGFLGRLLDRLDKLFDGPAPEPAPDNAPGRHEIYGHLTSPYDGAPAAEEIMIGLFPLDEPWHFFYRVVQVYPQNWDAAHPLAFLAAFKRWHDQYGGRIVTYTGRTIEIAIDRQPTPEEAIQEARLMRALCPEEVEDLEGIAKGLERSSVWYLWWD